MAADVISQGYARYKSGKSLSIWKKRWIVFRRNSSKGPTRIEQFENEDIAQRDLIESLSHVVGNHIDAGIDFSNRTNQHATEDIGNNNLIRDDNNNPESTINNRRENPDEFQRDYYRKTCVLTNVLDIQRLSSIKHALVIKFHDGSKIKYAFSSNMEAECWLRLLTQECIPPPPVVISGEPDLLVSGIQKELRERFRVYLMPTPKLEFFGDCLLQVTHENIYLWDVVDLRSKIAYWPLTALRRYGSDQNKFTFEAGRHCMTGEGRFDFHTFEGEKIYRKVHQATLAIAHAKTKTLSAQQAQLKSLNGPKSTTNDNAQIAKIPPITMSVDKYNIHRYVTEPELKSICHIRSKSGDQADSKKENSDINDKRPITPIVKRSTDNHYVSSQSLISGKRTPSQIVENNNNENLSKIPSSDNDGLDFDRMDNDDDNEEDLELEDIEEFANEDEQALIKNDSLRTPRSSRHETFNFGLDYPIPPPIMPRTSKNAIPVDINNNRIV